MLNLDRLYQFAARIPQLNSARTLDALPGLLTIGLLVFTVLGAFGFPVLTLYAGALLAVYAAGRFLLAGYSILVGLRRIQSAEAADWYAYYAAHATTDALPRDAVHHLVIVPNYDESQALLAATLGNLARYRHAPHSMTVVLAMEARAPGAESRARSLQRQFAGSFANLLYTLHPDGLPGETRCKSANQRWAARRASHYLVDECGIPSEHIVVTTMDADTLWHPEYFDALTTYYALDSERHRRFWQAPIRYQAGINAQPPVMQLVNAYATAFELAFLAGTWWQSLPMSSYSLSLRLLQDSGEWSPDVIADEWHMFIKAFGAKGGRLTLQPIFLPFLAAAPTGDTPWQIVQSRYRQSLRHAWGSQELGYALKQITAPGVNRVNGARLLLRIAHDVLLPGAGWLLMTLGTQLPLLINADLRLALLGDPLGFPPFLLMNAAGLSLLVVVVGVWLVDLHVRPADAVPRKLADYSRFAPGFALMPLMMLGFVTLPLLHAQARLLLGADLRFRVTQKAVLAEQAASDTD